MLCSYTSACPTSNFFVFYCNQHNDKNSKLLQWRAVFCLLPWFRDDPGRSFQFVISPSLVIPLDILLPFFQDFFSLCVCVFDDTFPVHYCGSLPLQTFSPCTFLEIDHGLPPFRLANPGHRRFVFGPTDSATTIPQIAIIDDSGRALSSLPLTSPTNRKCNLIAPRIRSTIVHSQRWVKIRLKHTQKTASFYGSNRAPGTDKHRPGHGPHTHTHTDSLASDWLHRSGGGSKTNPFPRLFAPESAPRKCASVPCAIKCTECRYCAVLAIFRSLAGSRHAMEGRLGTGSEQVGILQGKDHTCSL